MTIETEVAALTTAVNALTTTVNVKKATLDASVSTAAASATASSSSASASATSAQTAQAQASLAQGYAASASSVVQQDLSGITAQALHRSPNAITAQFIYDTSKDSDGGAWTERCQQTSWYNEALAGKWLGPQFTETFARYSGATVSTTELITNGNFSNGTTGWTASTYGASTISANNNVLRVTETGSHANAAAGQTFPVTSGKTYRVTFDVVSNTSSQGIGCWVGTAYGAADWLYSNVTYGYSFPGRSTFYFTAAGATAYFNLVGYFTAGGTSEYFEVANVSVREVTALTTASNDYFQLTTDGKFYRLYKNLLLNTGTLTAAGGWSVSNATSVVGATDPNAGTSAYTFTATANNGYIFRQSNKAISGLQHTNSIYVRRVSGSGAVTLYNDLGSEVAITLTTSWARYSTTWTATGVNGYCGIKLAVSGDVVEIWNPQEEIGNVATTYEAKVADASTSEIFRGNKADFPRLAAIVAEATSVNIYDLTEPGRPMWMRFVSNAQNYAIYGNTNALSMLNGVMALGTSAGYNPVDFAKDSSDIIRIANQGFDRKYPQIALRNAADGALFTNTTKTPIIVNNTINAVAMTVLPDAPIDPATGLRVPTIAVATSGGVSVIKHNGTVVSTASANSFHHVYIDRNILMYSRTGDRWVAYALNPGSLGASFAQILMGTNPDEYQSANPVIERFSGRSAPIRFISPAVKRKWNNEALPTRGLNMSVAPTFNTGWLTGDIRRAYLSDVTAEAVAANIQNEDFSSYADNAALRSVWSSGTPADISLVGGKMQIAVASTWVARSWPTVIGRVYRISVTVASGVSPTIRLGNAVSGTQYGQFTATPVGTVRSSFLATGTNFWASAYASPTLAHEFSSFVLEEVVADRSYKAALAAINGTLTKSQLASGTSLVGYSGYSGSNYLREPYSADLDFGTGEWNASAWVNVPATLPVSSFPPVGAELVSNGTFAGVANGTDVITLPGWSAYGSPTFRDIQSEQLRFVSTASGQGAVYTFNSVVGRAYRLSFQYSGDGMANIYSNTAVVPNQTLLGTGTVSGIFVATGTQMVLYFRPSHSSFVGTGYFDNISIREVGASRVVDRSYSSGPNIQLGVDAAGLLSATAFDGTTTRTVTTTAAYNIAQWLKAEANYTTDGSLTIRVNGREVAATRGNPLRPYYGRKNLINYSHTFSNAVWVGVFGGAKVSTNNSDPDGGTNAVEISFANQYAYLLYNSGALFISGQQYTISFWARRSSGSNAISVYADPSTNIGSYSPTSTWTRYSITFTWSGASAPLMIAQDRNASGFTNVQLYGFQLELGAAATTYTSTTDVPSDGAPLTIGNSYALDAPFPGSIALLKLGATVPTNEQGQFMYEQEKQLFRSNALSVLPDAGAVVDMAYDDATDRWVAVSAANESYWTGLIRNTVTPVPAGSYTKIVATSGIELAARSTTNPGVDVTIPAYGLREELVKRAEAAARLGKELVTFDYVGGFTANTTSGNTAITSASTITYPGSYIGARISGSGIPTNATIVAVSGTTLYISAAATATATTVSITFLDFALPAGMEAKVVFNNGVQTREGTTGATFSRLYDGFVETIRFAAAPGATNIVNIQAQRTS